MASLFLSGLMRLRWGAGVAVVVTGLVCSLFINLCRVLVLTWSAHQSGHEDQAVHDWVGGIATVLIFAVILLVAIRLSRKHAFQPVEPVPQKSFFRSDGLALTWLRSAFFAFAFLSIPWIASLNPVSDSETALAGKPRWKIEGGNLPAGWTFHISEPTDEQKSALRFSQWDAFQVRTGDGLWANVVHLFWDNGQGIPSMAFYHTPALCMPSAGWQEIQDPDPLDLVAYGQTVSFVRYRLGRDLDRVLVLQYLSRGRDQHPFLPVSGYGRLDRLKYLWGRSRQPVNEEILIYLPDLDSDISDTRFANQIFVQFLKPVTLR